MRILLDHCVPKPFGKLLGAHEVRTAAQMNWEELRNGRLLTEAAKAFDVFLTVDKNLRHEQNLAALPMAVIVLDAVANTPQALAPFAPFVERELPAMHVGRLIQIDEAGQVTQFAP